MAEQGSARKRRLVVPATPNACNECRKKRAKCDGKQPCSRCASRGVTVCTYDRHLKTAKEDMRAEINQLRSERRNIDHFLAALAKPETQEIILRQLSSGQPWEAVASQWGGGPSSEPHSSVTEQIDGEMHDSNLPDGGMQESHRADEAASAQTRTPYAPSAYDAAEDLREMHLRARFEEEPASSWDLHADDELASGLSRLSPGILQDFTGGGPEGSIYPPSKWTRASKSDFLVRHLMALYFCWEYPTFASLSKEHFMLDFNTGTYRYSSPLLVNAIMALGARFSDIPEARKDSHDARTAGDTFFEEAKRLYGQQEVPTLTTIQALGLMSLRQASRGNDASSWHYARQSMRMAIDFDLHRSHPIMGLSSDATTSEAERQVRATTFWGCFNLEQAWSLCIGRTSQINVKDIEIDKPMIIDKLEQEGWVPYADEGQDEHPSLRQPNNLRAVYKCFTELSELIHETLGLLLRPCGQKILEAYTKYLEWYDALPDQLRLGLNFTPTVLFTHMYYHFAILLLLRPLQNLKVIGSIVSPKIVCSETAHSLFSLIKSYKDLYTLRRTPSFVPYMILTASLAYLTSLKQKGNERVSDFEGLKYLKEMEISHVFAHRSIDILDYFARRWRLQAPGYEEQSASGRPFDGKEIEHHALAFPHTQTFFSPEKGPESDGEQEGGAKRARQVSHGGPLFSLFPQQGQSFMAQSGSLDPPPELADEKNRARLRQYGLEPA